MPADTLSLDGKVAIITGSGKENGIGVGIARALARNGAKVVLNHVSESSGPRAAAVAKQIQQDGGHAIVVRADVATQEGTKTLVEGALKGFGVDKVDILGEFMQLATLLMSWDMRGPVLLIFSSQQCRCHGRRATAACHQGGFGKDVRRHCLFDRVHDSSCCTGYA
jgi:hypothetical protein